MIDSHTHLHLCEPSNAQLVEAAAAVGVTRMLTVGIDGASCRAALSCAGSAVRSGTMGRAPACADLRLANQALCAASKAVIFSRMD